MSRPIAWLIIVSLAGNLPALAQAPRRAADTPDAAADADPESGANWKKNPRSSADADAAAADDAGGPPRARISRGAERLPRREAKSGDDDQKPAAPRRPLAKVTTGKPNLPTGDGQVWREYDISGYTARVTATNRPEQAIVDWILRETGYEAWHTEPFGLLVANKTTLTCYHTPEMQNIVGEIVDRYINPEAEQQAFALRVITIDNPNWRARAQRVLQPVPVETQGVQAWLLHTEDAALLLGELRRRSDFREHSSPNLLVANGLSTVVSATRAKSYIRDIAIKPVGWPGYENEMAQIDEGFSLELSPLLSLDGQTIDAILKCNIDQVERLRSVVLDVPTQLAPRQKTKLEVPQISHCRVAERFRWPTNQVLLIGLGVVATPVPSESKALGITLPTAVAGPPRADLLVLVEARGKVAVPATAGRQAVGPAKTYHGRY